MPDETFINLDTLTERLLYDGEHLVNEMSDVLTPSFSIREIFELIVALVRLAESTIEFEGLGKLKSDAVLKLWRMAVGKYGLAVMLGKSIKELLHLPRWIGWLFGLINININGLVEKLLIPIVVVTANKLNWGR